MNYDIDKVGYDIDEAQVTINQMSEEEITEALTTGNIPDPGARDEQMMKDQGIEGGGLPMEYKPLKHYSVKKGSHKHPHKKDAAVKWGHSPGKEHSKKTYKGGNPKGHML